MRKFVTVIARFIATIFAIMFVITTVLALILTTVNRLMFNANIYKNILTVQKIYERLPEIVGVALTSDFFAEPCAQNPLACNIDGASPELLTCLTTALGPVAYEAIGSGQRNPTEAELQLAQPCLDQYGPQQTDNPPSGTDGPGDGGGMPSYIQNLTAANWQTILTILLPLDDLQTMTEITLDQVFAYLNGETDTVTVPLDKLKERLTGPAGAELIMQLINSQPPCNVQELSQMIFETGSGGMALVLCKPPEVLLTILTPLFPDLLNAVATKIPDKAIIIKPPSSGALPPGTGPFGSDPITTIRTVRLNMRLSPLLPLAILLFVTLLAVRTLKSWMRWWGIPIFVSGTIALVLGISVLPTINAAWTMFIIPRIPPFIPADIAGIGQELVRSIVITITKGIVLQAIILLAIGLAAWIGSTFIKTKRQSDIPVTPPTAVP